MARKTGAGWEAPACHPAITTAQVLWLLLAGAVAMVPHVREVPVWVTGSIAAAGFWRLGAAARGWPLPGSVLRGLLTLLAALIVSFAFRTISGIDAGSALLILMLALKLLETNTPRDRSIVVQISWFVLFAGFLRDQTLGSVPQLAAGIIAGTLALLQNVRTGPTLLLQTGLGLTARLFGHALPLALVLFLLFPRLPGPFWALPASGSGHTGLSDQMSPGDITSLAKSDAVAFRVRFITGSPVPAELYWRGPVLERFDGRRWHARPDSQRGRTDVPETDRNAKLYEYEVTLEPHQQRWLLPLETPVAWNAPGGALSGAAELLSPRPIQTRMAYQARSRMGGTYRVDSEPDATTRDVAAGNGRTVALARAYRAGAASDADYLLRVLRMFREQEFYYTLEPPALGQNPVDDFLFRTRAGFCEHYASAFALLARAAGIPARVVAGYQGGEFNPVGGYWMVRQSAAHAWTEVWLDGRWVRYDPTAAVAPERIENGIEAAIPGATGDALPMLGGSRFLSRVALGWDATNAAWDRWVLAFGPERQTELMRGLGFRSPSLRELALVCAGTIAIVLLLFTVLGMRRVGAPRDPVEETWQRLCARLATAARPRFAWEGPREYADAVAETRPDLAAPVAALARLYLQLRYEGPASAGEIARFRALAGRLRVRRAAAPG